MQTERMIQYLKSRGIQLVEIAKEKMAGPNNIHSAIKDKKVAFALALSSAIAQNGREWATGELERVRWIAVAEALNA